MKYKIQLIKKLFYGVIFYPVFLISQCIPRSKKIWIFGAWHGMNYRDNTSYLFEYVIKNKKNIRAIWITRNKKVSNNLRNRGYSVFHRNSFAGFWYASRAGVSFLNCGYDDINKYCINRSFIIQSWHGVPLKKIKYDDKINGNLIYPFFINIIRLVIIKIFPFLNERYDLVISSSEIVTKLFQSAFKITDKKILEAGFPRMDIINNPKSAYDKEILFDKKNYKKCVLFSPTHRGEGWDNFNYFESLNFKKINNFLNFNDTILLIKMHFFENDKKIIKSVEEYSNIKLLRDQAFDINKILYHIDLLITDYSSVFYDFLILDKPIIFFPLDINTYNKYDREFYEEYNISTPGEKCNNWNEIQDEIKKYLNNVDHYKSKRKLIFNNYFKYSDNNNCQRIISKIPHYLNK